jgi:putative ABC transport system substrate-binding protein
MALNFINRTRCGGWLLALLLASTAAHAQDVAKPPDIAIVLSERSGSYQEFGNALDALLSGKGIPHRLFDSTQSIPASALVIGVGMKAASAVAASDAPSVLNVLISKDNQNKLLRAYPKRAATHTFSAIYLDQPIRRQVRLIAAILPDKHNVGFLYSSPSDELTQLRQELNDRGLTLHAQAVDQAHPLADMLQALLRNSDVLLSLPDSAVYNDTTTRNILLSTFRKGIPLIGFSAGYVDAGALCAVFSTPAQFAAQTAALIVQFGDTHAFFADQYPREFEVMINEQVARSLGLQLKTTSELHDEIGNGVRKSP